jgi:hypothetical protein
VSFNVKLGVKMGVSGYGSYLSAATINENFNSEKQIFKCAKRHLNFQYCDVNFEKFSRHYSENEGVGLRNSVRIRLYSAVNNVIYDIAKTAFVSISGLFLGFPERVSSYKVNYLKAHVFCVVRDVQEIIGIIATIFSEKFGEYYVQESAFQKECYRSFIEKTHYKPSSVRVFVPWHGVKVDPRAFEESLYDYKLADHLERLGLLRDFCETGRSAAPLDRARLSFQDMTLDQFVDSAPDYMLQELTFEDLYFPFDRSRLKFALMPEDAFERLSIASLKEPEALTKEQIRFIKKRLTYSSISTPVAGLSDVV